MTFAYKNIEAFIDLQQKTPELFNTQDRQTLADKIPEDIEEISESLLAWCEQRPEINDALQQERITLSEDKYKSREDKYKSRAAGGTFPDAQTQAEYEIHLRETLINALRQSSPPETSKPKTPKG